MNKTVCASLFVFLLASLVSAHAPSANQVEYDQENGRLKIISRHSVSNVRNHFVSRIIVLIGERELFSREFNGQEQPGQQEAVFSLADLAEDIRGKQLTIVSQCNVRGRLESKFTLE